MNLQQFINILWSRRRIALSVLMATVITTLVVSLLLPKQYLATTSIMIDQSSLDPVTGLALPIQLMAGYMATQAEVIASHNVARKVVEKLKLSENMELQEDFAEEEYTGDIKDWIADLLLKKLEIKLSRDSSLIQVEFTSLDPQAAADIANAFADAYVQTKIELRSRAAKSSADWFDSQMTSSRERLEGAQSALSTFQQQHGIIETDGRLDLENARLTELSRQLLEGQARTSELQSRNDLLTSTIKQGGSSESLEEVLNSPVIQSLKSELARSEAKFAELSKKFDINHPQYKQAQAEVNSLKQQIRSEAKMVLRSIASGVASSKQRDKSLADALANQKTKVLELKKQHDQIAVLNREVESTQREYDDAMRRTSQAHTESEMRQTNVAVLNPAMAPEKPDKPRVLLNLVLSVFLGGLLGMGSALLAELKDRRVRSAFDLTEKLAIPVFTVASSAQTDKPKLLPRSFNIDKFISDSNG
jgi:polysaccharide biosynthesis transport protein